MIFWRVLDDKLYAIDEVDKLGFETKKGLRIPLLQKQQRQPQQRQSVWLLLKIAGSLKMVLLK